MSHENEDSIKNDRDKIRRQAVVNFIKGLICDMHTPEFEDVDTRNEFVYLLARIKSAVLVFEAGGE